MHHRLSRRDCLVLASLAGMGRAGAQGLDPSPAPRGPAGSQAEIARQLSVPPPPQGVIDVQWRQLAPAGWTPYIAMARVGLDDLQPTDIRYASRMAKVRKEWDKAAAVRQYEGKRVRLTGYPVVLNPGEPTSAVLLAPYGGLTQGTPAPPPNQMAVVILDNYLPPEVGSMPIWVIGTLRLQRVDTPHGLAAYAMQGAQWKPYPFREHPFPPYTLRW